MSHLYSEESLVPDTNETFTNPHGQAIFCRYWECESSPQALVFLCHGYGEHSGRYRKIATEMSKQGIVCFAHDHVGHGMSEGDRVHVDDFMTYVHDVITHVEVMKQKHPSLPVFIYGHSMGGQITIRSLMTRPDLFRGAVFNAPLLMFAPELMNPIRVFVGRLLAKICPQAPIVKLDPNHVSSDPRVVRDFEEDPLNWHGYVKCRQAATTLDTTLETEQQFHQITHPFLLQHGTDDHLTYPGGSTKLHQMAASTDKSIQIYEGASHQLHEEPGIKEQVIQLAIDWIIKRSA